MSTVLAYVADALVSSFYTEALSWHSQGYAQARPLYSRQSEITAHAKVLMEESSYAREELSKGQLSAFRTSAHLDH